MTTSLPNPVHYVPYGDLGDQPNIVADGAPVGSTVLTLSHWPINKTPDVLKRDTSTATVFAYLDAPEWHASVEIVSNNHFDEDGLFSMFALCEPATALRHRKLLLDAALAGDFGVYTDIAAARLCFVIEGFADKKVSPLPQQAFAGCEQQRVANLYREMLGRLPDILNNLDGYRAFWAEQDAHLAESEALISDGRVTIDEQPETDLAIVHIPSTVPRRTIRRYLQAEQAAIHPFGIHSATDCTRIIRVHGDCLDFYYRYESWLQFASRRPLLRADLEALAAQLNTMETADGLWCAEKVTDVSPRLYLKGTEKTEIPREAFIDKICAYLTSAPVAWDPYDWDLTAQEV